MDRHPAIGLDTVIFNLDIEIEYVVASVALTGLYERIRLEPEYSLAGGLTFV